MAGYVNNPEFIILLFLKRNLAANKIAGLFHSTFDHGLNHGGAVYISSGSKRIFKMQFLGVVCAFRSGYNSKNSS